MGPGPKATEPPGERNGTAELSRPLLRGDTGGPDEENSFGPTASPGGEPNSHGRQSWSHTGIRVQVEEASFSGTLHLREELMRTESQIEQEGLGPHLEEYLKAQPQGGSSVLAAVFNVVNLFMGVALLSIVYAVSQGGWLSFAALGLSGMVMCLSGCLLGAVLEELPEDVNCSYPEVAKMAWGQTGRVMAVVFCFMELFGNATMNTIVMWHELEALLSHGGLLGLGAHNTAVMFGSLAITPLLLTGNLKTLSYLSLVGIVCTVVITASILSLVVADPKRAVFPEGQAPEHEAANPKVLLSVGIFCIALSQHSALPTLRNSMAEPKHFYRVMYLSFSVLVIMFCAVGCAGYYYFGISAHEIVTEDLQQTWIGKVKLFSGFTMNSLLILLVGIQGLSAVPTGIAVMQDMLLNVVLPGGHSHIAPVWATLIRLGMFLVLGVLAYLGFYVLGAVEGLIGGLCSMTCSLLLPVLLYTKLKWSRLGGATRFCLCMLIVVAVAVLLLVVGVSLLSMIMPTNAPGDLAHPLAHDPLAGHLARLYRVLNE